MAEEALKRENLANDFKMRVDDLKKHLNTGFNDTMSSLQDVDDHIDEAYLDKPNDNMFSLGLF
jgi:hypothetical protein